MAVIKSLTEAQNDEVAPFDADAEDFGFVDVPERFVEFEDFEGDFAEAHSEFYHGFDPVEQGYYDDDPSPYEGNYSEC